MLTPIQTWERCVLVEQKQVSTVGELAVQLETGNCTGHLKAILKGKFW